MIALTLARTAMGFQFQSVAVTAPVLESGQGFSQADIGWLVGLYFLPGLVLALPGGMLGARFGDRRVVLISLAMMVAGGAVQALAPDLAWSAAGRIVSGAGAVLLSVLMTKMVADWFAGHEIVLAMSMLINAWPIGIALASATLAPLAQAAGASAAFAAASIMSALGFTVVALGYKPPPGAAQVAVANLRVFSRREWRLLPLASLPWSFYNVGYSLIVASLPTWFNRSGMTLAAAGSLTAVNTLLVIVSVQAGGLAMQRVARRDALALAAIAGFALTFAAMIQSPAPLAWLVVAGLLAGLPAALLVSMPTEVLSPAARATGMGVFYTIFYLANTLLLPLGGWVAGRTGQAAAPLWLAIAMMGLAAVSLLVFRAAQRAADPPRVAHL